MSSGHDQDVYIRVEDVAERLKLSVRQASRYAAKIRTQRAGRRVLYHAGDVEQLAELLGAEHRVPPPPRTDLVPPGEFLEALRRQQDETTRWSNEAGRLRGILETQQQQQHLLTQTTEDLRAQLETTQAQRDLLQAELERLRRRSWWRRLLDI